MYHLKERKQTGMANNNRRVALGIYQRGKNYTFYVSLGLTPDGKKIRKTTTWIPPQGITQRKADKLAQEAYIEFSNKCKGLDQYNENMKFSKLVDLYFELYVPNNLKEGTAYNYRKMIDARFMPYFGNKKLKDINSNMLTSFFNSQTTIKNGQEQPLQPSTAKRIYNIMQSIFGFAVDQNYIKESPCNKVILPKKKYSEDNQRKYLTEDELPRFLRLFNGYSVMNTIVKLLLITGLRSGELLGLQWSDINFNEKTISVNHNLADVAGKHWLTTPKTRTSKRTIPFGETVESLLLEHKEHQEELIQLFGKEFEHPEMVFTSDTGQYKDRCNLNTTFRKFLKGTEFEFMTLHCLRHCNATILINSGIDIKLVSEHLGHSTINTTGNIYADVLESSKRKISTIVENVFIKNTANCQQIANNLKA